MAAEVLKPTATYFYQTPPSSGRFYTTHLGATTTTLAVSANVLYALPIFVPVPITSGSIGVEVTSFAAGNVRCGIYADSSGVPGTLLQDSGTVGTGTPNAFKAITSFYTFNAGHYWLAAVFSATPTVRAITQSACLHWLGFTSGTDTTIHAGWSVSFTYAALPNPFTGGGALMTGNVPRIMFGT